MASPIFSLRVELDASARRCVQYPTATSKGNATGGACFAVQVGVSVPDHHTYTVRVDADRFVSVDHPPSVGALPCLGDAANAGARAAT